MSSREWKETRKSRKQTKTQREERQWLTVNSGRMKKCKGTQNVDFMDQKYLSDNKEHKKKVNKNRKTRLTKEIRTERNV